MENKNQRYLVERWAADKIPIRIIKPVTDKKQTSQQQTHRFEAIGTGTTTKITPKKPSKKMKKGK